MGFAEVVLFIKSLPEMVRILGEINSTLRQLKQDVIDKELDTIRNEVSVQIQILTTANNDEQRKKALLNLQRAIAK